MGGIAYLPNAQRKTQKLRLYVEKTRTTNERIREILRKIIK